jgi:hypothetical protein
MRRYGCARSHVGNVFVLKGELALRLLFAQVEVERVEPLGERQALVDHRSRRQARDVEAAEARLGRPAARALADHEQRSLERRNGAHAADEELAQHRHRRARDGAEHLGVDRHVAPANDLLVMVTDRLFEDANLARPGAGVAREEALRDRVVAHVGELDAGAPQNALVVRVRDVEQDARAVAGAGIAPGRAAMGQAAQDLDPLEDHVVCGRATQIGHKAESASVAFQRRVVHATLGRQRHSDLEYTDVDATR